MTATLAPRRTVHHAPAAHVAGMFALIDACQWDALAAYFHEDVEYLRPGYAPIRGLDDLLDFYRHRRVIGSGRHVVELLCTADAGRAVSATGAFTGTSRQGAPLSVRFCDVYQFRGDRIARRETFFHVPAV